MQDQNHTVDSDAQQTVHSDSNHPVESDTDHSVHSDTDHTVEPDAQQAVEPDTVEVAVSTTGSSAGMTVCHEPIVVEGEVYPKCRSPGTYRTVEPVVYPNRRPCESRACWAAGLPDAVDPDS